MKSSLTQFGMRENPASAGRQGSRHSAEDTAHPQSEAPAAGQTTLTAEPRIRVHAEECPLTVREAAKFLGVSPQTVYLWVERKQIPHLRVMGRNIRFLKSDLEPFRASFKQEMENA